MKNAKNKLTIGITGTIGSGKSTITNCFKQLGYNIFDSDSINNDLLFNDSLIQKQLKDNFIECYDNNILNKNKLSNLVFSNNDKRNKLNSIMHPNIITKLDNFINDNDIAVCEVPLLFELNLQNKFDIIILVISNIDIIKERLMNKGYDLNKINNILEIQCKSKDIESFANIIFYNNTTKDDLEKEVYEWIKGNL